MRRHRYTIAEVRATYSAEKKQEERFGDWASALIYRPLSFLLTPSLIALGFSAGAVTFLSLCVGLSLPLIALIGPAGSLFWIVGLALAWVILDCVDGNIARLMQSAGAFGRYFDFVTDVLFRACLYTAIGILADSVAEGAWRLCLCLLAGYLALVARFCRLFHAQEQGADIYQAEIRNDRTLTLQERLFSFLSGIDRLLPIMLLAGGLMGDLDWVVVFLVVYSGLDFIYTQISIAQQLGS
ncbi:MAG: CDP-alcohol phosphatidyltransferase family protein [Alphaproteobacteria bacterium]|nr:CDP-alcohol phosphatidyltransferase family protein [Alphaproteobacteria bacterium]